MDSNYIAYNQAPHNNSKFINKIKKIRETSTNYMTVLHADTVIKGVPQPQTGKIRIHKGGVGQ